jgi:hypothetical protein
MMSMKILAFIYPHEIAINATAFSSTYVDPALFLIFFARCAGR